VVEIADFGAFVRIGPVDALLHVSQLIDDYMSYDEKQGVLLGKETKKKLTNGDQLRVRITAVSLGRAGSSGKIGVTARQPFLGKLEWLKLDAAKAKEALEKKAAEGKKEKISEEKE
jgi:DNA-directed RNA polymerase subunit E'